MFRDGWVYGVRDVVDAFPLTEDETRVMKTWLKRQQFEGMAAFRNVKDCNGGDRARWQGNSEGKKATLHHGVDSRNLRPESLISGGGEV